MVFFQEPSDFIQSLFLLSSFLSLHLFHLFNNVINKVFSVISAERLVKMLAESRFKNQYQATQCASLAGKEHSSKEIGTLDVWVFLRPGLPYLGVPLYGRSRIWEFLHLGTLVSGHSLICAFSYLCIPIFCRSHIWALPYLSIAISGHSCIG